METIRGKEQNKPATPKTCATCGATSDVAAKLCHECRKRFPPWEPERQLFACVNNCGGGHGNHEEQLRLKKNGWFNFGEDHRVFKAIICNECGYTQLYLRR